MIGKAAIALLVPTAVIASQQVPPDDPVDVAWATIISIVITRILDWWIERRKTKRDRYRR